MSTSPVRPRKRLYSEVVPGEALDLDSPSRKVQAKNGREFHSAAPPIAPAPLPTQRAPEPDVSFNDALSDNMSISSEPGLDTAPQRLKRKREDFETDNSNVSEFPQMFRGPASVPAANDIDFSAPAKRAKFFDESAFSRRLNDKEEPIVSDSVSNDHLKEQPLYNELEERFFVNAYYSDINSRLNRIHFDNLEEKARARDNRMVIDEPNEPPWSGT
jgi:hypothetical protein